MRGLGTNKTKNVFFANGTETKIVTVEQSSVKIPDISWEIRIVCLASKPCCICVSVLVGFHEIKSSGIFKVVAMTSFMLVVRIEECPPIYTPWNALQAAAWDNFLGSTAVHIFILRTLFCCH